MAPVAPHRTNVEKNRLVFGFGARERFIIPFVPVNWLVRGGAKIRTG
jgi:hypothetical protein